MPTTPYTIEPNWPAPAHVHAHTTLRHPGHSRGAYAANNLGLHVGDDAQAVKANRAQLTQTLALPAEPHWLTQTHSTRVVDLTRPNSVLDHTDADGSYSDQPQQICTVLTADCLPILLCDTHGTQIAALHAGWRGLANGIIEAGVKKFTANPDAILAWLGPAIGPNAYEVGPEVYQAFSPDTLAFKPSSRACHYYMDIYQLASLRLNRLGIRQIYGGDACTYSDADRFFSYRRDSKTGRMATLIWFDQLIKP